MAAYMIVLIRNVQRREGLERYWEHVGRTFAGSGAKPLSIYAPFQTIEGEAPLQGVGLVEFPSIEAARNWYFSDQYQAVKTHRAGAAEIELILADGAIVTDPALRMPHIR
jgi:uncharacterized protein (DUF1330 family)